MTPSTLHFEPNLFNLKKKTTKARAHYNEDVVEREELERKRETVYFTVITWSAIINFFCHDDTSSKKCAMNFDVIKFCKHT